MCHLADGRIISCGMDSKICLWSIDKRNAVEVISIPVLLFWFFSLPYPGHNLSNLKNQVFAHRGSISKLAADRRYNLAVSCGYDRAICLWKFPSSMGRSRKIDGPFATLTGLESLLISLLNFINRNFITSIN